MTTTTMLQDLGLLAGLLLHSGLGVGTSYAIAELVRDVWHLMGHKVPFLWRWVHSIHHRVYGKGWKVRDPDEWVASQWIHGVPEAALMVIGSLLFTALCFRISTPLGIGSLYGVGYTIRNLGLGLLHALNILSVDGHHAPNVYHAPPKAGLEVDQVYHAEHHYGDIESGFSGVFKLFDMLAGTARSLKRKRVGITGGPSAFTEALIVELKHHQPKSITLFASDSEVEALGNKLGVAVIPWQPGKEAELEDALDSIDILIVNHGLLDHGVDREIDLSKCLDLTVTSVVRLAERFISTIAAERFAKREVWISTSVATKKSSLSPRDAVLQQTLETAISLFKLQSRCLVRKIAIAPLHEEGVGAESPLLTPQWAAKTIIFWSSRDVRSIIVSLDPVKIAAILIHEARYHRALQSAQR